MLICLKNPISRKLQKNDGRYIMSRMKRKTIKRKKFREVLAQWEQLEAETLAVDLEMYKEAMRLERERRKSREFFVI